MSLHLYEKVLLEAYEGRDLVVGRCHARDARQARRRLRVDEGNAHLYEVRRARQTPKYDV